MRARWSLPVGVVTACASPPDNPTLRAPLLTVDRATGAVEAVGSAPVKFVVEFGREGIRMPQGIFIDGVNRIAATGGCPTESGVGIAVTPALTAVAPAYGGPTTATGGLQVEWAGPVIAKIVVTWGAAYACASPQEAHGASTFTIFPNGRIVRHDDATPSTTSLTMTTSDCGCSTGGAGLFSFTSFWTFAAGAQNVQRDGSAASGSMPEGCAVYPEHMIGVAWPSLPANKARLEMPGGTSAYVYDLVAPTSSLEPVSKQVSSALMLSQETSPARCDQVIAELDDVPITVAGMTMFTDLGGMYVDERRHTDPIEIAAPRRLPPFAISLDVGDFAEVTRSSPRDGDWYSLQDDGGRTIFWFRDGLDVGESIAIRPR